MSASLMPASNLLTDLARIVGQAHVLTSEAEREFYAMDVYNQLKIPLAVIQPGTVEELQQVLVNLMGNARDACAGSASPQVVVRSRFVSGLVLNVMRLGIPVKLPIEISISDNGPGVDPALREHIFEPFVSSKPQGQGLGLALVQKLVRDMDGRISHEREEARGDAGGWTHFRVHLPMARQGAGA